jgi:NADH-quinone oxidoreductase subunit M
MLNHGLSTGALFLLVGMIYERRHTRQIADFGGLAHRSPVLAAVFLVVTLSSIGLPGLNGFVGEVLVLAGTFVRNPGYAAVAATGMILGAVYMLWTYQRVFFGGATRQENLEMGDIGIREKLLMVPILLLMLWIGVYSAPFLTRMEASLKQVEQRVHSAHGPAGGFRVGLPAQRPGTSYSAVSASGRATESREPNPLPDGRGSLRPEGPKQD